MPPRRNTRPADNPQPLPRPGFQSVLNSLLAQRDAALGVTVPSQPIARWESSSQPEILWELLAERRRAGIPPTLSQEQNAAVEAAIAHIPTTTVTETIVEMESAVAASQGASPALTVVSDRFWEALQLVLPASGIPPIVTQGQTFQQSRTSTGSGGSSPMDTSSDGIVAPAPHSPSLITPRLPIPGDSILAPILLSSDSDNPHTPPTYGPPPGGHVAAGDEDIVPASPLPALEGEAATPSANPSIEESAPSNVTPLDSVSSWGRDAAHPLEVSPDPSTHSSLRASEIPDVPNMGSARRGGKMSTAKVTDELENAGPAVLARARYLNVVPARDTRSSEPVTGGKPSHDNEVLRKFALTDLSDGSVFTYANMDTAHEEAIASIQGTTEELSSVRLGFAHYYLRDPLSMVEDPSVPVESTYLRKMADIVGAVLCGGPCSKEESIEDVYASTPAGDWFRLATFTLASVARGCARTPGLLKKGSFPVQPCKDDFTTDPSIKPPPTQAALLQGLAAQIMEELQPSGALLPQDSVDGLRATVWRAHEGQIRAWTEREVLSVYKRLSDICLSDILDKIESEASIEEITEVMRDEIAQETRGKFNGLIAAEKTKAYNEAVSQARADALREALATGAAEAANKGKAYSKMILERAEDEARIEGDKIYKARLESLRTKMKRKAELEVEAEHALTLADRRSALEANLTSMDFNARKDYVRSQAIQLGLLNDSATPVPSPPKRAKVGRGPMTTPRASAAPSAVKSAPSPDPSSCPAAEEDAITPRLEQSSMEWSSSVPEDPLPSIDFDAPTRSSASSRYAPGNAMEEDPTTPKAVASFRDPDVGALPIPSTTPSAAAPSAPSVAPTQPPTPPSEIKQLADMISNRFSSLEKEIARVALIVDGKNPPNARPKPAQTSSRSTLPKALPASSSFSSTPAPTRQPTVFNRIDDEEEAFPPLGDPSSHFPALDIDRTSGPTRAPAQAVQRFASNRPNIGLSFASVVTEEAMRQQDQAAGHARLARGVQKRNPSGKAKPGHSAAPQGFTDVVVIRRGGCDDSEIEEAFRRRQPVDIAQAAQRALNALVRNPPIILRGRWSETVEKTGNFVFRFAGNLPAHIIASYQAPLCDLFPASESACVVPTAGWTWVQFRGVDIASRGEEADIIYSSHDLETAIRANPCFNRATFCVTPHWQGNPANFKHPSATVIAAILDADNEICQRASSEGVCMFGRRIKFVRAGASPSLVQCSRCHEVGHYYTSPKCKWTTSRCYRCGGSHDARDHDFECKKQHKTVGVCDCTPKCILCKNSGHHAREKGCPVRGDFVPPRLPRAAPAEALPAVEDAYKSDAIPQTRPRARPAHGGGKRGGKGKRRSSRGPLIPLVPEMIEDICAKDDDHFRAYCFCCPALRIDEFQALYCVPPESDITPGLSAKGKSAQDIFGECILRKNTGKGVLHSEDELRQFLSRAAGDAVAHIDYAQIHPAEQAAWLANMPTDEEAGWGAESSNAAIRKEVEDACLASGLPPPPSPPHAASLGDTIAEADRAVSSWKDVKRSVTVHLPEGRVARQTNLDGSLVTVPRSPADRPPREGLQLDPRAGRTEHAMVINRQVVHVGWSGRAQNQFEALAVPGPLPAAAGEPSEVVPNA
jgi:hypothetical protein